MNTVLLLYSGIVYCSYHVGMQHHAQWVRWVQFNLAQWDSSYNVQQLAKWELVVTMRACNIMHSGSGQSRLDTIKT